MILFSSSKNNGRYQTGSSFLIIPHANTGDKKIYRLFSGDFRQISKNFAVSENSIERTHYFSRLRLIAPDYSQIKKIPRRVSPGDWII